MNEVDRFGSHYSRIKYVSEKMEGLPRLFEGLSDDELKSVHIAVEVELEYRGLLKDQINPIVANILEEVFKS